MNLGCHARHSSSFYIDLLVHLRSSLPSVAETPRRVWDLYKEIVTQYMKVATTSRKELEFRQQLIKEFEAISLILHNGTWGAEVFFGHVLEIRDFQCKGLHLLDELDQHRESKAFASLDDIAHLYRALGKLAADSHGLALVAPEFREKPHIAIKCDGGIKWLTLLDCIWPPGLKVEGKVDLSQHYPDLRSFFVDNLKLPKYTSQEVWMELISLADNPPVERTRDLFLTLNTLAVTNPTSMEHSFFIGSPIYPVKDQKGKIIRVSGNGDFFIADKAHLADSFSGKVNILAFTPRDVLRLEQFFTWAGMQNRYLSLNVQEMATWPSGSKPTQIEWTLPPKQMPLIATYFGSPRADTPAARRTLLKSLRQGQMLQVDGITKYDPTITMRGMFPQLRVSNSVGQLEFSDNPNRLIVHVPADKEQQELARFLALPGLLVKWLMTNPKTKEVGKIHESHVGLIKDVLNAPISLVGGILKLEGIPDVEGLNSPEEFSVDRLEAEDNEVSGSPNQKFMPKSPPPKILPSGIALPTCELVIPESQRPKWATGSNPFLAKSELSPPQTPDADDASRQIGELEVKEPKTEELKTEELKSEEAEGEEAEVEDGKTEEAKLEEPRIEELKIKDETHEIVESAKQILSA
ncbi:hypothetical protein FSARC_2622 [Fusarium sarcochroum]|uniref:Uncharacterized protein n=1 Tax=Fusarium sarcochroum TaxID=1208366 RepID=A0A8H4U656_9HYPO|nr:hypothetical protein FSARC_2622 [Fusarium sarcochroum]